MIWSPHGVASPRCARHGNANQNGTLKSPKCVEASVPLQLAAPIVNRNQANRRGTDVETPSQNTRRRSLWRMSHPGFRNGLPRRPQQLRSRRCNRSHRCSDPSEAAQAAPAQTVATGEHLARPSARNFPGNAVTMRIRPKRTLITCPATISAERSASHALVS